MSAPAGTALLHALTLQRAPRGTKPGPEDILPEGMLLLLKLAAGEEQAIVIARESTGESVDLLREAAAFYIQQVMFSPSSDSYRVLGVDPDASEERVREHYRWLARWLHPDRNPDEWEAVYADRVNSAWQDLRTTARRLSYDQVRADSASLSRLGSRELLHRPPALVDPSPASWSFKWLPEAILAGLGASAIITVCLFYVLRWAEQRSQPARPVAAAVLPARAFPSPRLLSAKSARDAGPVPDIPVQQVESQAVIEPEAVASGDFRVQPDPPVETVARKQIVAASRVVEKAEPGTPARAAAPPSRTPSASRSVAAEVAPHAPAAAQNVSPPIESALVVANTAQEGDEFGPSALASTTLSGREATRVLNHFSRAYEDGSLTGMRELLAPDVRSSRGGIDEILADYNRLFESSDLRSLAVRDVSWFANGATFTIIASYDATVTGRNHRARRSHGDLRLDVRREGEQWRIYRLFHEERHG